MENGILIDYQIKKPFFNGSIFRGWFRDKYHFDSFVKVESHHGNEILFKEIVSENVPNPVKTQLLAEIS